MIYPVTIVGKVKESTSVTKKDRVKEKEGKEGKDADAPKNGERRLRRIMKWTNSEGVKQSYTAIYNDRGDIALLNQMVSGKDAGGFVERRVLPLASANDKLVDRVKRRERELQVGKLFFLNSYSFGFKIQNLN